MAEIILKDAYISINSNVLSDHTNQVSITYEAETKDNTTFGDGARSNIAGLLNYSISVTFLQDIAGIDAILFPLIGQSALPFEIRHTSASVGVGNPKYTGKAMINNYTPIGGSVGDLDTTTVTLMPSKSASNDHILVRATT